MPLRLALTRRGGTIQVVQLIEAYEARPRVHGHVVFDDTLLIGLRLIETHGWVRRALQARFPAVVVHE